MNSEPGGAEGRGQFAGGAGGRGQFALACASHTPLVLRDELADAGVSDVVRGSFARLSAFVTAFAPDYIVQFAPDHFHGFHYDNMPSFCVGAGATSYGDWGTAGGALNVDEDFALALLDAVRDADIDAAVSFDMIVDHGFVQMWELMFGGFATLPIVPIFVNAVAHPLPTFRRARLLGQAVGRFAAASGHRVLFAASGGLSHDPVVPVIRGATPEVRPRLIGRSPVSADQQAARERAVEAAGAAAMTGGGPSRPLNPAWDRGTEAVRRLADDHRAAVEGGEVGRPQHFLEQGAEMAGHDLRRAIALGKAVAQRPHVRRQDVIVARGRTANHARRLEGREKPVRRRAVESPAARASSAGRALPRRLSSCRMLRPRPRAWTGRYGRVPVIVPS